IRSWTACWRCWRKKEMVMAGRAESEFSVPASRPEGAALDAGLLLSRMEACILGGERLEQVRGMLQKVSLRQRLGPQEQLRWADLAQMAEQAGTARAVLEDLNRAHSEFAPAWERHLELLSMVGTAEAQAGL